jgi:hypothetical protein
MNAGLSLLTTVAISLILSTILVNVLAVPLRRVLAALCSSGEASGFWVSFTSVMLYIAPLLFAVFTVRPGADLDVVSVARTTLVATLFGAFLALLVVGFKIADASPRNTPNQPSGWNKANS